jgi:hypothetical protein
VGPDDVEATRAVIADGRVYNPEALRWGEQPGAFVQAPVALGGAMLGGWSYAMLHRKPTPLRWTVFLVYATAFVVLMAPTLVAMLLEMFAI